MKKPVDNMYFVARVLSVSCVVLIITRDVCSRYPMIAATGKEDEIHSLILLPAPLPWLITTLLGQQALMVVIVNYNDMPSGAGNICSYQ